MKQLLEQQWTADLWDRINQHNFAVLADELSASQFAAVKKMLEPIAGINYPVLEKQKAAIVQMLINVANSGGDLDAVTTAVSACENIQLVCHGSDQATYAALIGA